MAGLIQDAAGDLYGTTIYGGSNGNGINAGGTVFKVNDTGHETVLYSFCSASGCADGAFPQAGVIQDAAGNLYGTTTFGGANGFTGTAFKAALPPCCAGRLCLSARLREKISLRSQIQVFRKRIAPNLYKLIPAHDLNPGKYGPYVTDGHRYLKYKEQCPVSKEQCGSRVHRRSGPARFAKEGPPVTLNSTEPLTGRSH